ncbi:MAG: hypothetical protein WCT85_01335 [Parachlamydiales bacterium]|jgi:hypothetical protein
MKSRFFIFLIFISFFAYADVPREQIETELSQAEKDFQIAKKMFNPWYGGPLLTGSGNVLPPGYVNINPVLQITDNFAAYNASRHAKSIPDFISINPSIAFGVGIVNRLDTTLSLQGYYQSQSDEKSGNIGDTSLKFGLAILKEEPYVPALKVSVKEIFPTGKYKNLKPEKANVEGTGGGSYKTELGLGMSKVVWWWITHPMQFRLSLNYGFPAKVGVKNFNSYGGGFNTRGHVSPGNYFTGSFGYEFSFTQKFAFAVDLAYEYHNKTTFSGFNGTSIDGDIASIGGPSNDFLSLAPAFEYNFTPDIALIIGAWFSVWGRNSLDFGAGLINFSYGF